MLSVALRVKTICRGVGALKNARDLAPGALVGLARELAELVHATMHVGVVLGVVARDRVDDDLRLLRRRRVVEIDERPAARPAGAESGSPPAPARRPALEARAVCGDGRHAASTSARSRASCA